MCSISLLLLLLLFVLRLSIYCSCYLDVKSTLQSPAAAAVGLPSQPPADDVVVVGVSLTSWRSPAWASGWPCRWWRRAWALVHGRQQGEAGPWWSGPSPSGQGMGNLVHSYRPLACLKQQTIQTLSYGATTIATRQIFMDKI